MRVFKLNAGSTHINLDGPDFVGNWKQRRNLLRIWMRQNPNADTDDIVDQATLLQLSSDDVITVELEPALERPISPALHGYRRAEEKA